MTRVTVQDLRSARYCLKGARAWFARHGFDWREMLAGGIEAARLQATGDALVEAAVKAAEVRERRESATTRHDEKPALSARERRAGNPFAIVSQTSGVPTAHSAKRETAGSRPDQEPVVPARSARSRTSPTGSRSAGSIR